MTNKLEQAYRRRSSLVTDPGTTAYRAFGGGREGIAGVVLDVYGKVGVLNFYEGKSPLTAPTLREFAAWWFARLNLDAIYLKTFVSDRTREAASEVHYAAAPYLGRSVPSKIEIKESGLTYLIRPYAGYSTGIFLDQRHHRAFLAERSRGKRVLNGFAYSCAFSVACAARGASAVTSVDLSKKYLEWGKANFAANSLAMNEHRFVSADMLEYFRRLRKKEEKFDLIILDPPSFARMEKGKVFSIPKHLYDLWEGALACLAEDGEFFFSTNYANWTSSDLEEEVARFTTRLPKFVKIKLPQIPVDFEFDWNPVSRILVKLN